MSHLTAWRIEISNLNHRKIIEYHSMLKYPCLSVLILHVYVSWCHQMTKESNIPANYNNMLQEDRPQRG